ncbi:hypothetical protein D9M68_220860 [compost metagenome]
MRIIGLNSRIHYRTAAVDKMFGKELLIQFWIGEELVFVSTFFAYLQCKEILHFLFIVLKNFQCDFIFIFEIAIDTAFRKSSCFRDIIHRSASITFNIKDWCCLFDNV